MGSHSDPHADDAHHVGGGHDHDHDAGHGADEGGAPLGPIDRDLWGAGVLGSLAGLLVAGAFYLSLSA